MKKLTYLFVIILLSTISYAGSINECKTDIYFGNGVWNKQFSQDNCINDSAAECSRIELNKIIQKEIIKNDSLLQAKYSEVKLQYNWGRGWDDVLEVYYQLREAGQVNNLEFFAAIAVLTGGNIPFSATATAAILAKMPSIADTEQTNINQMLTDYYLESFLWSHRVLLVSHSQGNLFANRIYDSLDPKGYQNYFANVQVASPASSVHAKMGKEHITNRGDMIINPIPGSMLGNVDPDPENRLAADSLSQCIDDLTDGNFSDTPDCLKYVNHEFVSAYLGQKDPFGKILAEIYYQLAALDQAKTQWEKTKDIGCLCKEKRIKVAHKFDEEADTFISDEMVFEFDEKGKIYSAIRNSIEKEEYVRAACGGETIKEVDEGEICYKLEDNEALPFGTIKGDREQDTTLPDGLFTASLSWHETIVEMEMANELMSHSINGCGFAKLSSGDLELKDVYPGTYPVGAAAEGYEEVDDSNLSDIVTLKVKAVTVRKTDKFEVTKKYQYPSLGKGGHIADIIITRPEPGEPVQAEVIPTVPSSGGGNTYGTSGGDNTSPWIYFGGGTGGGGSSATVPVSRYKPPLCKTTDCDCMPCEYKILTYLNQTRLGPVSGANVVLYKATQEDDINREILYTGKTGISNKIDEAGTLSLPVPYPQQTTYSEEEQALLDAIAGYEGDFILEVSGGFDIDRDDDFVVDSSFTQVNGKLHLVLSKERLLQNDYKINILTEIGYQLSKDLLGENYDKARLQARLDDIAKRVLIEKLYPDASQPLGRDDLFYWIPMAHKNWLVKPYDSTLAPIVDKVYAGETIYDEAYNYVYNPLPETLVTVPVVRSQWFKVDENLTSGSQIAKITLISEGNSSVEGYDLGGEGSKLFRVDTDGVVYLEDNATLDYEAKPIYQLQLRVRNADGESKPVTLYIVVNNILDVPEDRSFSGGVISEDTIEGDIVGVIHFNPGASAIERIEIGGENATDFTVDLNGTIRVSGTASFDYETRNNAKITLQAFNSLGGSRAVSIRFSIIDAVDVPIVQMLDTHLDENASNGQVVGKVNILTNDPLLSVILVGDGHENFSIDLNGTVRVAGGASLDYETRFNYVLQVQAVNIQGTSRLGTLIIRIDNVADVPQLGYTTLHMLEGSVLGTSVGHVTIENHGNSAITDFTLTDIGSEHFIIDEIGNITVNNDTLSHSTQEFFNLYVTATNSEGTGLRARVVIYIDTQRPILGILDGYVYEDAGTRASIGAVPAVSSGSIILSMRLEGIGSENFHIDAQGKVSVASGASLDYEQMTHYNLRVFASNDAGESDGMPLYIRVADRADTLKITGFWVTICEDIPVGTTVGFASVVSLGGKTIDHYELTGTGSENFSIGSDGTMQINTSAIFNSTQTPKYHLALVAVDTQGVKSNQVFVDISVVKNIDTVPQISDMSLTVSEDTSIGTILGQMLIVSKAQVVEQAWFTGEGSDAFEIQTDGTIKLKHNLDYELKKTYNLIMFASNALGQSQGAALSVTVTNIIDDEPLLTPTAFTIAENVTAGTILGQVQVQSIGASPIKSMSLKGVGAGFFSIDSNGTVKLVQSVDYESKQVYHLQAIATNAKADSPEADVTINVSNIAEHIPVLKPFAGSIKENAGIGTVVGTIKEDTGGDSPIHSFKVNDTDVFSIDSTGILRLEKTLDYRAKKAYRFQVYADNSEGRSKAAECLVEVLPDDQIKPVINLLGAQHIYHIEYTPYQDPGVVAHDDIDGEITSRVVIDGSVDPDAPPGSRFVVTYNVTDLAGNQADTVQRIVTIIRELNTDLSSWKANGQGNWALQSGNRSVLQTINGYPTIFHNDTDSQNEVFMLNGKITVTTSNDDDYIGFVLGYHNDDLGLDDVDYLLVDWKQGDQSGGKKGLAISRITKSIAAGAWTHDPNKGIQELQRAKTLGNTGWRDYAAYLFNIKFTSSNVQVYINDSLELNVSGTFSDGAYGFYNYSQEKVLYWAIESGMELGEKPVADAGIDQNVTLGDEITLDGSSSTDDGGIVSYIWEEDEKLLGTGEMATVWDLESGSHAITLTVIDDDGNSDLDDVIIDISDP